MADEARQARDGTPVAASASGERIAKRIARAGLCSRRDAERWIADGRVKLDGEVLSSPAVTVTSASAIEVDGKPLPAEAPARLFRFHKPTGYLTAASDPEGRKTFAQLLPDGLPRLMPIGRLDMNSEGLLLLTNDGGLKRQLELPSTGWQRRYRVRVHGDVDEAKLVALTDGISIDGFDYGPIEATLERVLGKNAWLNVALREGKNREIRRVMEHFGWPVNRLIRVSFGPFHLGKLEKGAVDEIKAKVVKDQIGMILQSDKPASHRKRRIKAAGTGERSAKAKSPSAEKSSSRHPKSAKPSVTARGGAETIDGRKAETFRSSTGKPATAPTPKSPQPRATSGRDKARSKTERLKLNRSR